MRPLRGRLIASILHAMTDIDHRAVIAGLSPADRAALTSRSDGPGLWRITVHFGAIVAIGAAIAVGVPFWPLLLVPQGVLIVFLFTALHETIHETAFSSSWLNRAVATICGFLILLPPAWFRYFHFAHHRFTQDPDNDPELMAPKPATLAQYLIYLSGARYWSGMAATLARNALGTNDDPFVPPKGRDKVIREARAFLALYAVLLGVSVAGSFTFLWWVWALPAILGQPFLRAYLLAEHARCPEVANMLQNTRTTYTTAFIRLIAWNMPYHAEHHAYPAVPFHKLPRFNGIVREHLRSTENGYARFHRKYVGTLE